MVNVEKAVIARYKYKDHHFEILVDGNLAMDYKNGKNVSIRDILASEEVFKDAKKGERASENLLEEVFGTTDVEEIAKIILKEGEIQLTTEYKRKLVEEMKKRIIDYISKNAMDARTKKPIPPQRIENAIEQARIHIDPFKPFEKQVKDVVDGIRRLIPISFEEKEIRIHIPARYSAQAYGAIKEFKGKKEWMNDGSLISTIMVPAGLLNDLYEKIGKITHGEADIKEV